MLENKYTHTQVHSIVSRQGTPKLVWGGGGGGGGWGGKGGSPTFSPRPGYTPTSHSGLPPEKNLTFSATPGLAALTHQGPETLLLLLLIYFDRDRERASRGGAEREGESPAGSSLSAQSPTRGSNSRKREVTTRAETQSQALNPASHPGAPRGPRLVIKPSPSPSLLRDPPPQQAPQTLSLGLCTPTDAQKQGKSTLQVTDANQSRSHYNHGHRGRPEGMRRWRGRGRDREAQLRKLAPVAPRPRTSRQRPREPEAEPGFEPTPPAWLQKRAPDPCRACGRPARRVAV